MTWERFLAYVALWAHEIRYAHRRILPVMVAKDVYLYCPHVPVVHRDIPSGALLFACNCGRIVLRESGYLPSIDNAKLVKWLMRQPPKPPGPPRAA